jgi:hypothetical protein
VEIEEFKRMLAKKDKMTRNYSPKDSLQKDRENQQKLGYHNAFHSQADKVFSKQEKQREQKRMFSDQEGNTYTFDSVTLQQIIGQTSCKIVFKLNQLGIEHLKFTSYTLVGRRDKIMKAVEEFSDYFVSFKVYTNYSETEKSGARFENEIKEKSYVNPRHQTWKNKLFK